MSERIEVRVADVLPNDGNPRTDPGDLKALEASVRATGGQPVQPIIVVPDGGRWRLVDGWRRWLAMREIGTERCDALCFDAMGEAEEAVCAMATDSKEKLSDEEAGRGFQTMLALGVSDERIAGVVGAADPARVARARRVAREIPEQATMDAIMAAADDDFDADERQEIMAAHDPRSTAEDIRSRHRAEGRRAAIREELPDGVEYRGGDKPWDPEGDDLSYLATVRSAKAARAFREAHGDGGGLVVYADGMGWALYEALPEGEGDRAREARESEVRRRVDDHQEAYFMAWSDMRSYVLAHWRTPRGMPRLAALVTSRRGRTYLAGCSDEDRDVLMAPFDSVPSLWEVGQALASVLSVNGLLDYKGELSRWVTDRFTDVYDAIAADGWEPEEDVRAIREMCRTGKPGEANG